MAGPHARTNECPGTRAVLRNTRTSAFKIREVLDLVRGLPVASAQDVLRFCERDCADLVLKLLNSAIANAENNDSLVASELFVAACFADEGRTTKTFRPRARGRAGKLRKRSAHITVIVARLPEQRLTMVKAKQEKVEGLRRTRRVAASQKQGDTSRPTRRDSEVSEAANEAANEADNGAEIGDTEIGADINTTPVVGEIEEIAIAQPQAAVSDESVEVDQPEPAVEQAKQADPAEDEEK